MTCDEVETDLVAYHFGALSPVSRQSLEAHLLLQCAECVRAFVFLKRDIETADQGLAPSSTSRARLRSLVARELGILSPRPSWRWWEKPLAWGVAAAAVTVALVTTHSIRTGPRTAPRALTHLEAKYGTEAHRP